MKLAALHQALATSTKLADVSQLSMKEQFGLLGELWLRYVDLQLHSPERLQFIILFISGSVPFLLLVGWIISKFFQFPFFSSAFEKIKFKRKEIDKALADMLYLEITIPHNSQATAFQIQQKILKTLHSIYADPIAGAHNFTFNWHLWFFFQKFYRFIKVWRSRKVFFTMQIWGQYPCISFRLNIPRAYLDRIEKALYNAYPGAEIAVVNKETLVQAIMRSPESYLSYGQSKIVGQWQHLIKTFRDVSSDPVDSIISTMEGLKAGEYMVFNVFLSPASHFFNQLIHFFLEEEEHKQQGVFSHRETVKQIDAQSPDLLSQLRTAKIEKMKASLFQVSISYWTIMPTAAESREKLENIQSVLTQVNQKNMNTLEHKRLFTKQVKELQVSGELENMVAMRPVITRPKFRYFPLFRYKNYGQIISDSELYSLWHLPNITPDSISSIRINKFKKLPASQDMRLFGNNFFIRFGTSNFSMHEGNPVGIPTWDDMKKHVYILGGTGAGKSETLKTILSSLLNKNDAEKTALLIVDPKNDFATDLLTMIPEQRKDDVVYFNPSKQKDKPLGFPFFSRFSSNKPPDERIEFLISIMKRFVQIDSTYSWGPELENILRHLFATAYLLPEQSLSGLDRLLHDHQQVSNLMPFMPPRLEQFWRTSIIKRTDNDLAKYLATTNNKIGKLLDYPEFTNIADRLDTKITFEQMIAAGKIFIANLGSCSEHLKKYYSVYLTAHVAEAIFDQAKLSPHERKPAVFVVDEFQRVASDIFETLFSEVRAFNTSLVISNQFMGQLDDRIKKSIESNIATKIFMRTQSVDDAEIAEKILGNKVTGEDIINLPTGHAYIKTLVNGIPQETMSLMIERVEHPTADIQEIEQIFVQQTMDRYGTPLSEIHERREKVNKLYYTAEQEREFQKEMERHKATTTIPQLTAITEEAPLEIKQ